MINKQAFQEVLCNLCGLSCRLGREDDGGGTVDTRSNCGLIDGVAIGGYESTPGNGEGALDDMTRYKFSLCEFCLDWLFCQFKIPVAVDDPMNDYLLEPGETIDDRIAKIKAQDTSEPKDYLIKLVRGEVDPWRPADQRVKEDDWRRFKDEYYNEAERRRIAREKK